MTISSLCVRRPNAADYSGWKPLWDGYNAFYGREGPTAPAEEVALIAWQRFFDVYEPVHALVAELDGAIVGLTHYLFHRSTTRVEPTCYLQDLFTLQTQRGKGVGRQLIEGVYAHARREGIPRVYWQTHSSNAAGRLLYDKVASHDGFIVYSKVL
ncbi:MULTISPECIES: GNAT family N-acetyltransferase [Variovorax]|uniref:GNAT family N-acetyltransferase n=1 Tax=Variovorax TaxID=34072 RepID=UPI00285EE96B|nr:GNAT family N-acetyltransferase [Variovorax sp. 3319]MDR6890747.1 GNAT superfamily N-acetyltransferase [Variovorax sp. 3319]